MVQVLVDYDMDEVDEAWLGKFKGKKGLGPIGLGGEGPSTSAPSLESSFEAMMGRLERMAQDAVVQSDEKNGWLAKGMNPPPSFSYQPHEVT